MRTPYAKIAVMMLGLGLTGCPAEDKPAAPVQAAPTGPVAVPAPAPAPEATKPADPPVGTAPAAAPTGTAPAK